MALQNLLDARDISKYRLSQMSGVPKTTIMDICSGKSSIENCNAKTVYLIAKALNCTVESLLQISAPDEEQTSGFDAQGFPQDRSYLERGLPQYLYDSIAAMQKSWEVLDRGERNNTYDLDYCELQADINRAEVDEIISSEQAWYLREKYLRISREDLI